MKSTALSFLPAFSPAHAEPPEGVGMVDDMAAIQQVIDVGESVRPEVNANKIEGNQPRTKGVAR